MGVSCSHFRCRPGTFNMQLHNPAGCSSCFCHGHSKVCATAAGFRVHRILSDFRRGKRSPRGHPRGVSPSRGGATTLPRAILPCWGWEGGREAASPAQTPPPAHSASLAARADVGLAFGSCGGVSHHSRSRVCSLCESQCRGFRLQLLACIYWAPAVRGALCSYV